MANTVSVNIRIDEETKKQAEQLFADLGMNMSTAINIFIRQSLSYGGIPFEIVRRDDFYNHYNQQILKQSINQLENGKGRVHDLIEAGEDE